MPKTENMNGMMEDWKMNDKMVDVLFEGMKSYNTPEGITIQSLYDTVRTMNIEIEEIKDGLSELEGQGIDSGAAHKILKAKLEESELARQSFLNRKVQIVNIR